MVIDLKVLVKSFNREDLSCYAGNPRESLFLFLFLASLRQSTCLFAKVSRKLDYESLLFHNIVCIYSLLRATTSCRPGVRQEKGNAHLPFPA